MKKKKFSNNGFCLVLSGGGTKGVYHIGVWKALQEMEIEVTAFLGNSIGAIVAGYLSQGQYKELEALGDNIGLNNIIKIPESLIEGGVLKITSKVKKVFSVFYKKTLKRKSLDTGPLRKILERDLNEEKIRQSGTDLGVVIYSVSELKAHNVFLDTMEKGTLIDHLMASSSMIGFDTPVIGGKKYIDGGFGDNMPYAMARNRGYRKIIVVDISGVGISQKPMIEDSMTVYIKNSINMGGIMDFNKEFLHDYRELGYLDTLRTFGLLKGFSYFIEPMEERDRIQDDLVNNPRYLPGYQKHLVDSGTAEERILGIRNMLPLNLRLERELIYPFVDCAAAILGLERIRRYGYRELIQCIRDKKVIEDIRIRKAKEKQIRFDKKKFKARIESLAKSFSNLPHDRETPYFYYWLVEELMQKSFSIQFRKDLLQLFPQLRSGLLFLEILAVYDG